MCGPVNTQICDYRFLSPRATQEEESITIALAGRAIRLDFVPSYDNCPDGAVCDNVCELHSGYVPGGRAEDP